MAKQTITGRREPDRYYVRVLKRDWLRRVFMLSGDADAVIEYSGRTQFLGSRNGPPGFDETSQLNPPHGGVIKADGRQIVSLRQSPLTDGRYSLTFDLQSESGPIPIFITADLSTQLVPRLDALRIVIHEQKCYEEHDGRVTLLGPPPQLPIPAVADEGIDCMLPLPSEDVVE